MGCTGGIGGYNVAGVNFSQGAHDKDKCNILQRLLFSNINNVSNATCDNITTTTNHHNNNNSSNSVNSSSVNSNNLNTNSSKNKRNNNNDTITTNNNNNYLEFKKSNGTFV